MVNLYEKVYLTAFLPTYLPTLVKVVTVVTLATLVTVVTVVTVETVVPQPFARRQRIADKRSLGF